MGHLTKMVEDRLSTQHFRFISLLPWCMALMLWVGEASPESAAEDPGPLFVEGYAGRVSYAPGEELSWHVSTTASAFSVEIVRQGGKAESVWSSPSAVGHAYPVPEDASSRGC